jgi:ketosteroid isomerase-like protein
MRRFRNGAAATLAIVLLAGCSGTSQATPTTSAATPEDTFRSLLAAIEAGDAAATAALLSPGGHVFGEEITADNLDSMARKQTCTADLVSIATTGDGETVRATVTFTGQSSFASGPCNATIGSSEVFLATVRDGKIVSLETE